MSERVYDTWRAWRHACITSLADISTNTLRMLVVELRGLADAIDFDLARRSREAERQDARLYKPKGRSQ